MEKWRLSMLISDDDFSLEPYISIDKTESKLLAKTVKYPPLIKKDFNKVREQFHARKCTHHSILFNFLLIVQSRSSSIHNQKNISFLPTTSIVIFTKPCGMIIE